MRRRPIESSSIRSVGYDKTEQILEIEWAGGGVYQYLGVPEFVHRALLRSDSPGTFVNSKVKPNYRFTEV
jgi:hypothetical protein